jgi:hypothetical protein
MLDTSWNATGILYYKVLGFVWFMDDQKQPGCWHFGLHVEQNPDIFLL